MDSLLSFHVFSGKADYQKSQVRAGSMGQQSDREVKVDVGKMLGFIADGQEGILEMSLVQKGGN